MSIINVISQSYPSFLAALLETVKMTILTLVFATLLGTIIGLLSISKIKPLKFITTLYIDIIRGTPLLVQIFVVYYGVAQAFKPMGFSWNPIGGAFTAGVVTLTLNAPPIWQKSFVEALNLLIKVRWRPQEALDSLTEGQC